MNYRIIFIIIFILLAIWLILSVCKSDKKEGYHGFKKLDNTYLLDTDQQMYLDRKRSCCGMRMM